MASRSVPKPGVAALPDLTFEICSRFSAARRQSEVRAVADRWLAVLGAELLVCIEVPALAGDTPWHWIGRDEAEWTPTLLASLDHDPVVRAIRQAPRPAAWNELIGKRRLAAPARRLLDQARERGLREGFAVPVFGVGGLAGLVLIAGPTLRLDPAERLAVTWMANCLFERIRKLKARRRAFVLTSREIEILRWIVAGKSDWQIGQILRISSKTVNFHVENVKRKFAVATRIQAVIAAVRRGNIQP